MAENDSGPKAASTDSESTAKDPGVDLKEVIDAMIAAERAFREGLVRVHHAGLSANEIARRVGTAKILSRPKVLELLRDMGSNFERIGAASRPATAALKG